MPCDQLGASSAGIQNIRGPDLVRDPGMAPTAIRRGIGFTDSSNPFYLFSKRNVGLLLCPRSPLCCEKSSLS